MDDARPRASVVLVAPLIPGNTGTIGRTCVALDLNLILIKPYGFDLSEQAVRRAGLDYWQHVRLKEYDSWHDFLSTETPQPADLLFFEEFGGKSIYDVPQRPSPYLVFGQETKGLPENILKGNSDGIYALPMRSGPIRSLNLSNAVAAVVYQALRDTLRMR